MVVADAEKAAEAHHRIADLAGLLVDHDALDGADLVAVGAVDIGAFHLVAADQRCGFPGFCGCCRHDVFSLVLSALLPCPANGRARMKFPRSWNPAQNVALISVNVRCGCRRPQGLWN
jgi:hypothetical protein